MIKTNAYLSRKEKNIYVRNFTKSDLFIGILSFFVARASIIDNLTPFGIGLLSAYLFKGASFVVPLSIVLGLLSFHGMKGLSYIISIIIIIFLFNYLNKKKKISILNMSIISASVFSVVGIINILLFKDFYFYDLFMVLFEGLVVFTMSYIFSYSFPMGISLGEKLTKEGVLCTFVTLALALAGIDFQIWGISLKNVFSIFLILSFGYKFGASWGGIMGITIGLLSYTSRADMPFLLSIYGLSGLLSGIFKDLGKTGSVVGFLLGNSIMSFYINGFSTSFLNYKEIGLAIGMFYLLINILNEIFLQSFEGSINAQRKKDSFERKKEIALENLENASGIFKDLSEIFKDSIDREKIIDPMDFYTLVDNIANSVCKNCSMRKFCWEEDFYTTYYSIFSLIELIDSGELFNDEDLPQLLSKRCINKDEVIANTNKFYDLFKVEQRWKGTMLENRELVSEQMESISKILKGVAEDIDRKPSFKEDLEEIVYIDLLNEKVDVLNVMVSEFKKDDFEISIEVGKTFKKENSLENVKRIVSNSIDIPLRGDFNIYNGTGEKQKYKLVRANRYGAITKVSKNQASNTSISGDSYTYGEKKNRYFIALSDGMGTGRKANNESAAAILLLEKFLEAGFSEDVIIKTINSMLMMKSNDEIFATLDISLLDMYSGKVRIIKSGAAPTFIKRKDGVEIINAQSLPVGILKDVDFQVYETYLEDGDFLIMMSDGLLEANTKVRDKEKWMKEVIMNLDTINPSTLANNISKASKDISNEEIRDDMTVLVTKMWKIK